MANTPSRLLTGCVASASLMAEPAASSDCLSCHPLLLLSPPLRLVASSRPFSPRLAGRHAHCPRGSLRVSGWGTRRAAAEPPALGGRRRVTHRRAPSGLRPGSWWVVVAVAHPPARRPPLQLMWQWHVLGACSGGDACHVHLHRLLKRSSITVGKRCGSPSWRLAELSGLVRGWGSTTTGGGRGWRSRRAPVVFGVTPPRPRSFVAPPAALEPQRQPK